MRLVLVINSLGIGGAEKVFLRLAQHWSRQNHEVFLINFLKEEKFYHIEENKNLKVINFDEVAILKTKNIITFINFFFNSCFRVYKLQEKIKSLKPDLIIAFMIGSNLLSLLANIFCKLPIVISERADPNNLAIFKFYKILAKVLYPYATALVVQTKHIAEYFTNKLLAHKVFIIPNFVKRPNFYNLLGNSTSQLNNMNIAFNSSNNSSNNLRNIVEIKNIISIGRLDQFKDHKTLIYAFSKAIRANMDLRLTILGEGILRSYLVNLVKDFNLTDRIFLPGTDLNVEKYLLTADLFIFPSISEGFPNALCEAMSYGLPVIAADCPGNQNIITDNKDGLLFKCGDVEELFICMLKLINNNTLANQLANNAKNIIERFDEQNVLNMWDEVLNFSIMQSRKG